MRGKAATVLVTGVAGALLGLGSWAWACTGQPRVFSALPESGPAGSPVVLRGENVTPGAPLEIRWNSISGQKLATATADSNGSFSVPLVIPDASPEVYAMVIAAGDAGMTRMSFEVTPSLAEAAAPASVPNDVWQRPSDPLSRRARPGPSPALPAGVALLAVGLVALFSGTTVAAVRRRRVPVAGPSGPDPRP